MYSRVENWTNQIFHCIILTVMETYIIGSILKEYRTRLKISQEDLSAGLCDMSTLSRIESGKQIPGRKLVEGLFSKMGLNPPLSAIPMTKKDFKREQLEYKITDMIATGKFEIADMLEAYKNCSVRMTSLEEQFYLFYKTMSEDFFTHDCEKALENYAEAIRLTIKDYEIGKFPTVRFLTKTELLILNNISRSLYYAGKEVEAIQLMEYLRTYFETKIMSEEEKAKNYPVILHNLENWYGRANEDEKVIELCDIGIDICILYGKLTQFPFQVFNKGCSLVKLGKIEEGKKCLSQAFTILEAMKEFNNVEYGKKWVAENLGLIF